MIDRRIVDYTILEGYRDQVSREVKKYLEAGWRPWGAPLQAHGSTSYMYCQAMVKYEDGKENK